jgi:hypothetical protein
MDQLKIKKQEEFFKKVLRRWYGQIQLDSRTSWV